jgi:predicted small metal-binding protein
LVIDFKYAEIGIKCAYQETAQTVDELKAKIAPHVKSAPNMAEIPKAIMMKIEAAIKEI